MDVFQSVSDLVKESCLLIKLNTPRDTPVSNENKQIQDELCARTRVALTEASDLCKTAKQTTSAEQIK